MSEPTQRTSKKSLSRPTACAVGMTALITVIVLVTRLCLISEAAEQAPAAQNRDAATATQRVTARVRRAWGPEQATGAPDTRSAGDWETAWASLNPDSQREWLLLEFAEPILPKAVVIHETFNPGAVNKVGLFDADGKDVAAWTGTDPTPRTSQKGVSEIPVKVTFKTKRVKIYVDSPGVPGWNEIDAVGLRVADGKTHWATKATASSTFAEVSTMSAQPMVVIPARELERLVRLEAEVKQLRKEVDKIKRLETEVKELRKLLNAQKKRRRD